MKKKNITRSANLHLGIHESAVRKLVKHEKKRVYLAIENFEEAKKYNDSYLIMEGDWGGQIYLSIPVREIKCGFELLCELLKKIDLIEWPCNEGEGANIYFERLSEGSMIEGGMGGGRATDSLWVHTNLKTYEPIIMDVIQGKKKKYDLR